MSHKTPMIAGSLALACLHLPLATAATMHAEQSFTVPQGIRTPLVLQTAPDAACDLHAAGDTDPRRALRVYANGEGFLRVHLLAPEGSTEDSRVEVDCTAQGEVETYPLRLRIGDVPTADMPAPRATLPAPQGSRVVPGLTEADSQQMTDADLQLAGYPRRPDASSDPEGYAQWLKHVSTSLTVLPEHLVAHESRTHLTPAPQDGTGLGVGTGLEAGTTTAAVSPNWSGYVANSALRSYAAVSAKWSVPAIAHYDKGAITNSSFWVGLDGWGTKDLVQAGTEQDSVWIAPFQYASYYAWEELLPDQKTEQGVSVSPNAGDEMAVEVWIDNGTGVPAVSGAYANFVLIDWTQHVTTGTIRILLTHYYNGYQAEWIMERPTESSGTYAILSDYGNATMTYAYVDTAKGVWVPGGQAANTRMSLYNQGLVVGTDNNLLSQPSLVDSKTFSFAWKNYY